ANTSRRSRQTRAALQFHFVEQNFSRQRVPIGVQAVRSQTENYVARFDFPAGDDLRAIDYAHNATGEIVFPFSVHCGHLRCFTTEESAAGGSTGARKAAQ